MKSRSALPCIFQTGKSVKEKEGIYFALWPRTGGRQVDEFTDGQLKMLGRYLGRIHLAGRTDSPLNTDPKLDLDRMVE